MKNNIKNNLFILFSIIVLLIVIVSCNSTKKMQRYLFVPHIECDSCNWLEWNLKASEVYENKAIIIQNDSIVEFFKRYGGLGSVKTVKYLLINNDLITDSVNTEGYDIPNVTNVHFLYSKDSLVNTKTNEKYYNQKYLNRISKK